MRWILGFFILVFIVGVANSANCDDGFFVGVTLLPQKFFVEQIAGKRVQVITLIPQGADPHTYEPKPKDMEVLKKAKVYFAMGEVEVERVWLDRFRKLFPQMRVINISSDISFRGEHYHRERGVKHEHREGGKDPHVWLSPPLVMLQSRAIYRALVEMDPEGKPLYDENFKNWMSRLVNLDIELAATLAPFAGRIFIVYHPAWIYFAEAYNIKQVAVEKEGKAPGPKDLDQLKSIVFKNDVRVMFTTSEMPQVSVKNVSQQLGLMLDVIDPLAYDWETNMRTVAKKLVLSWGNGK